MPFNWPGTLAALQAFVRPRVIIPNLIVQDIRELDFAAFRRAGYEGVVLDKDNCLTLPYQDGLIPDLEDAWKNLKYEFGPLNSLIVSNSAGTRHDAGGLAFMTAQRQAESVSHLLGVSVLRHSSLKPSHQTISAIQRYFSSLPSPILDHQKLVVIGDRVLTDIVLANRMRAYSVLVTRDWDRTFNSTLTAKLEHIALRMSQQRADTHPSHMHPKKFTKEIQESKAEVKLAYSGSSWTWTGRALGWGSHSGRK